MATFDMNKRGGFTVDRESLHASDGYKRQIEALRQLQEKPMSTEELRKAVEWLDAFHGTDPFATGPNEWLVARQALRDQEAEIARLRGLLGQCYAISGEDTDGGQPERHADHAVKAVTDLRRDYDEVLDWQARCDKAEALLRDQEAEIAELREKVVRYVTQASDYSVRISDLACRAMSAERRAEKAEALLRKAADLIPSDWDDPLMRGPESPLDGGFPYFGSEIEKLLAGIRARITAHLGAEHD